MEAVARATEKENNDTRLVDTSQIKGWAVDADPENDPTYPMKERKPELDHAGYSWDRPEQQPAIVEVFRSPERPNLSATFGTSTPPSGLSGMIRRASFNLSEDSQLHWASLILADRIQMLEGLLQDFSRGRIPNIFSELGWKAEWKHNRAGLVTKVAIGAGIAFLAYSLLSRNRRRQ
jgi:hypothetical protein